MAQWWGGCVADYHTEGPGLIAGIGLEFLTRWNPKVQTRSSR